MKKVTLTTLILLLAAFSGGCSLISEKKRVVYEATADSLNIESTAGQAALMPVAVPVAWGTLIIDGGIVTPVWGFYEAGVMTKRWVWDGGAKDSSAPMVLIYLPRLFFTLPAYTVGYAIYVFSPWDVDDF